MKNKQKRYINWIELSCPGSFEDIDCLQVSLWQILQLNISNVYYKSIIVSDIATAWILFHVKIDHEYDLAMNLKSKSHNPNAQFVLLSGMLINSHQKDILCAGTIVSSSTIYFVYHYRFHLYFRQSFVILFFQSAMAMLNFHSECSILLSHFNFIHFVYTNESIWS